jgi:hypothetical protein
MPRRDTAVKPFENYTLGVPPPSQTGRGMSIYDTLEAIAKVHKDTRIVSPTGGTWMHDLRWTLRCTATGLVHRMQPMYGTKFWVVDDVAYPIDGLLSCGEIIVMTRNPPKYGSCDIGPSDVVDDGAPLTCLTCLADSGEARAVRQEAKQRLFGMVYGQTAEQMTAKVGVNISPNALEKMAAWLKRTASRKP